MGRRLTAALSFAEYLSAAEPSVRSKLVYSRVTLLSG